MNKYIQKNWIRSIIIMSQQVFLAWVVSIFFVGVLAARSGNSQKLPSNFSITLKKQNSELSKVLNEIEKQTGFKFSYLDELDKKVLISVRVKNSRLDKVLESIEKNAKVTFRKVNDMIAVSKAKESSLQNEVHVISLEEIDSPEEIEIFGKVTDENGVALPGVSVVEKGTSNGKITDSEGNYRLNVSSEKSLLSISFLGYKTLEISLNGRSEINIQMTVDVAQLQEVVVIGYGQREAKDVTGSVKLVKQEDFNGGVVNSPGQLLQGKVSGVNITSGSGEPGSAVDINIRGVSSISGSSNPLFVIDGVPVDGVNASGAALGGQGITRAKNPLNFLNPQDIESMTILKDASATAIYGTRGANGVVIIETKKGKSGQTTLSYNTYYGMSSTAKRIDVLSAQEYKTEVSRLATLLGRDASTYIDEANADTDWQDEIFRTAMIKNHGLSFSGGNENTIFNASVGYLDQDGIIKNTGHRKITGRINIGTSAIDDRLKLRINVTAADLKDESQATGGSATADGNLLTSILRANPTAAPYDTDGNLNAKAGAADNPVSYLDLYRDRTLTKTLLTNLSSSFEIIEGLSYKVNLGYESTDANRTTRIFPNSEFGGDISAGRVARVDSKLTNALVENYISYNKSFGDMGLTFLAGHSFQQFNNQGLFVSRSNFSSEEIDPINNIGIATDTDNAGSTTTQRKLQSYFGRVEANLLDKYLLTASIRADGSSVFGINNRYGYFPSFALGWRLSEEGFFADSGFLDNLKLRLTWGRTGNQAVPVKVTQRSFSSNSNNGFVFNGRSTVNGITVARTANPDLKWEVTTQYNFGLDWSVVKGRLSGVIDYFNKTTTDIFLQVAAPAPAIVSNIFINADTKIINKGIELAINADVVRTENFSLDVRANISFLDNTIKNLATDINVGSVSAPGATGERSAIYRSGYAAGSFFLPVFLGFDEDGYEKLSDEAEIIGDAFPDIIYGFNINAQLNRFDLSLNFNGVKGVDIFNNTARAYSNASSLGQNGNNIYKAYLNADENPERAIVTSSRYVENGDFLRLNNVTLGYNLDVSDINWLRNLRLYLTGQNLLTITDYSGYDPEVNTSGGNVYGVDFASYPRARTFLFGLNVTF